VALFAGGLQLDEEFQVFAEVAFGGINAALQVTEFREDDLMSSGIGIIARYLPFFQTKVPDVGFDGGESGGGTRRG
jgi:hypothetical protein